MNYYLDKTLSINGTCVVNGSVINIKSEKHLIELTSLVDSNKGCLCSRKFNFKRI